VTDCVSGQLSPDSPYFLLIVSRVSDLSISSCSFVPKRMASLTTRSLISCASLGYLCSNLVPMFSLISCRNSHSLRCISSSKLLLCSLLIALSSFQSAHFSIIFVSVQARPTAAAAAGIINSIEKGDSLVISLTCNRSDFLTGRPARR